MSKIQGKGTYIFLYVLNMFIFIAMNVHFVPILDQQVGLYIGLLCVLPVIVRYLYSFDLMWLTKSKNQTEADKKLFKSQNKVWLLYFEIGLMIFMPFYLNALVMNRAIKFSLWFIFAVVYYFGYPKYMDRVLKKHSILDKDAITSMRMIMYIFSILCLFIGVSGTLLSIFGQLINHFI